MFITIEGSEFIGKSTLADALATELSHEYDVVRTYEPGGTELADDIRALFSKEYAKEKIVVETELMLVTAARIQHVHNVIKPALENNKIVVCDRYVDSTRVYQGRALDPAYVEVFISPERFPQPDLTLLLTCDHDVIRKRMEESHRDTPDRFDKLVDLQKVIQSRFMLLIEQFPDRIKHIDTTDLKPDEVLQQSLTLIQQTQNRQPSIDKG